MFCCMCKFVFGKYNSNRVFLFTLKVFQKCSISAALRHISRSIARLFYLNKVFLYIIYLCFWHFFSVNFMCPFYVKYWSNKTPRNLIDSFLYISLLFIIRFDRWTGMSSFLLAYWRMNILIFPHLKIAYLQWTNHLMFTSSLFTTVKR